jgi:hypothetical protein
MSKVTKADLQELDGRIDQAIGSEMLLSLPRDVALMNLLRFFEDYCRLFASRHANFNDEASYLKLGQDGMQFAVDWIHSYCDNPTRNNKFDLDSKAYVAAGHLHEAAIRYSLIWDLMAQLYRGTAIGDRVKDDRILLTYENPDAEVFDTASHFLASPDAPNFQTNLEEVLARLNPAELLDSIRIQRHRAGRIKYSVPDEVFGEIAEVQRSVLSSRWELGEDWSLGEYTMSEFRDFWITLLSICWIHNSVCFFSGFKGGALESVVKAMSCHGWQSEISRRSGLKVETAAVILKDLIYDPALYENGNKQPDVTSQPFFCLRGEFLAVSNQLVLLSNAERNLWNLISIIRPEIHSRLRNEKEALWLKMLSPKLQTYGLRSFGPIKFEYENKRSDLDLLLIDDAQRFGLGLQLKWLNHPDRIRDVKYADSELLKGLDQAELAREWLKSQPLKLNQLTGLSVNEMKKYEFQTAVLSKNTLGSTSTIRKGFPILTERLLEWTLGEPHHCDIKALWQVGDEQRYLPQRGKHYVDIDVDSEFGGIRLIGKKMGMRKLKDWDPLMDIDLSGLEREVQNAAPEVMNEGA